MSAITTTSFRSFFVNLLVVISTALLLQSCGGGGGGGGTPPAVSPWGTAQLIETENSGNAVDPQIAIDASGNALAVWYQDGDATAATRYDIWANRYTASTGLWGTATLIETDNAGNALGPQIAFDASGNAIAVWQQDGDATAATRNDIWANRYQ